MTRTTRVLTKFGLLFLINLTFTACRQAEVQRDPTPTLPKEITVGLSLSNLENPFFMTMKEGAEEAAQRLGVSLSVLTAQDDPELQNNQIQVFVDQNVSVLIINPVGGETVLPAIQAANSAGIPVITIDRSAPGGEVLTHIASDNQAGGKMAASYLAESLGEKGAVVELEGIPGTSAAEDRGYGFNQAIAGYTNISIIERKSANFDREEARRVFAQILEDQPDIDGVFAHNDEMILGAIDAAREAGRMQAIVFVGFDAIEDAIDSLEDRELAATIAQQPAEIGRLGIEAAVKYLNGEDIPPQLSVDLALVTR